MPIALTADQRDLAAAVDDWAREARLVETARAAEGTRLDLAAAWKGITALGLLTIAVPEEQLGGGGTVVDLACAVEALGRRLAPGPLVDTAAAVTALAAPGTNADLVGHVATGEVSLALCHGRVESSRDAGGFLSGSAEAVSRAASHVLLPLDGEWLVLPSERVTWDDRAGLDLASDLARARWDAVPSAEVQRVDLDPALLAALVSTLGAALVAGGAAWCVETAVEHARTREQFGAPIGSFQAVKHLCSELLERTEALTALTWDAAAALDQTLAAPQDAEGADAQAALCAAAAAGCAADTGVWVANTCIQVLGGIGFTWEHDAHLYLRRAVALRALLGGTTPHRAATARLAIAGHRRERTIDLGPEAEAVRAEVRRQAAAVAAAPEADRRRLLVEARLLAPHWPEPFGRGAGPAEQVVIAEELARAGVVPPDLVIGGWAVPTILEHGTQQQRERFVRPTLLGELEWCQLFSEPEAGSDLAGLRTRALRVPGGWRLSGQKVWTSRAQGADWAICLARTDPEAPRHRGIGYFLVDMRSEGLEIRPLREITGDALFNEVFLDDVFVPDDCLVGGPTDGWRLTRTTLANERVAMAGARLGLSVERALRLVREVDDPVVLDRVGAAVTDAMAVSALEVRQTLRSVSGAGPGPESSVAKLLGTTNRQQSAQLVVDLLGAGAATGAADVAEAVWELLNTRCLSIAGGTTQILRNVVAERLLGLPR